jgi:hypothetical protein
MTIELARENCNVCQTRRNGTAKRAVAQSSGTTEFVNFWKYGWHHLALERQILDFFLLHFSLFLVAMGVCLTWFAVRGKDPEAVLDELGLDKTGQRTVCPWPHIAGAELSDGWYLIERPNYECRDDDIPGQLSVGCEVMSLFVEEHVMFARVDCWKDGKRVWSVVHDSEEGGCHLETEGDLPPEFALIRDEIAAKKEQMPFMEIPCRLAATLTGYRFDGRLKERPLFEVLALPPWWERLLASYAKPFWSR